MRRTIQKMEVNDIETTVAHYGDVMTFLVTDQIGESNLTILCDLVLVGSTPNSEPLDQMQWNEQSQAYELPYDSTQFGSSASELIAVFSCDMRDEVGNIANGFCSNSSRSDFESAEGDIFRR